MICKGLIWQLMKIAIFCIVITFIPGIPPDIAFKEFSVKRPHGLHADISGNRHLDNAQHLFEGELVGPEAFAVYDGAVYTGVHGGFVVRIDENKFTPIVKFGKKCDDLIEEQICGRPLGMKFDKQGNLYVADAYYGIFKYNLQKGETTPLVSIDEEIEGKKSAFVNDVAVAGDGTVYFTVTSTTFPLFEGVHAFLNPGDGRVIKYDPQTKRSSVLADGLLTPNGIVVSPNDDFLLFSESSALRILKYNLKGSKKNTLEVFAESLPGVPDNIRFDGAGGLFVSCVVTADETHPVLPQVLASFPNIRRFISRMMFLLELPFAQINKFYPNYFCQRVAHSIGHLVSISILDPKEALIIQLDSKGVIKDALVGKDGSIAHVSDMVILENDILLGSPYNNFIGRVPRPSAPHRIHIKSVRYEEASNDDSRKEATSVENQLKAKKEAEAAAMRAAQEAKAKKDAEEAAVKAAQEAKAKKEAEEAALRAAQVAKAKKDAEEAAARAAQEAKAKKDAEEAATRAAQEAKARKDAEEAAVRAAQEAKARRDAEEAKAKKAEAAAKKAAEETKARKLAEEAARKAEEEARLRKAAEETAKRQQEAQVRRAAEEARIKANEGAARRAAEHTASKSSGSSETNAPKKGK